MAPSGAVFFGCDIHLPNSIPGSKYPFTERVPK